MLVAQAVVDAARPAFEVGGDAVRPRQHDMRGHCDDGVGIVVDVRDAGIAGPAVGLGGRPWGDVGRDEGVRVQEPLEANRRGLRSR